MKVEHALSRIDPYPFQHRVRDVMRRDAPMVRQFENMSEAITKMAHAKCSAALVVADDGKVVGIITERDAIDCWAKSGAQAGSQRIADVMTAPIVSISESAFVYTALARMNRLSIRHLAVLDPIGGKPLGLLEIRALMRWRIGETLGIGDEIAAASDGASLAKIFKRLPEVVRALRLESVAPSRVASVISGVIVDITARASELVSDRMIKNSWGHAPAKWCMLVLGSAGRGESLLAADQDNALIHAGDEDDHPWFEELGRLTSVMLNDAGIPFCRGGVMAANPELRHNREGWWKRIQVWLANPQPVALLNADIFYDFVGAYGDLELAGALREESRRAKGAKLFLRLMADEISGKSGALDWFGRFRQENGRTDLKMGGLFPIVAGGRVLALKLGSIALSSQERWRAAFESGIIVEEDYARLLDAHEMILGLILDQQLADIAGGRPVDSTVAIKRLLELDKERLRQALHIVGQIDLIVRNALQEDQ